MAGFSQSWAGHARAVPADLCPFVSLLAHLFPFAWFLPHTVTGSSSPMLVSAEQTPGPGSISSTATFSFLQKQHLPLFMCVNIYVDKLLSRYLHSSICKHSAVGTVRSFSHVSAVWGSPGSVLSQFSTGAAPAPHHGQHGTVRLQPAVG